MTKAFATINRQLRTLALAGMLAPALTSASGQTAFADNFNRTDVHTGTTTPSAAIGNGWTFQSDIQTPARGGARIIGTELQIGQTSADGYAGPGGSDRSWIWQDTATWASPFTPTLANNPGVVVWSFNMRTGQTNPTPVSISGGATAVAVLATAEPGSGDWQFGGDAAGYIVTYNDAGTTDPLKLILMQNGVRNEANHTVLISATSAPFNDLSNQFLSVRVTYDPATSLWTLSARNDGAAFQDPRTGLLTELGTATDNTHTATALPYAGFLGNSNNGFNPTTDDLRFDNFVASVQTAVEAPIFSPAPGNVADPLTVAITTYTSGATIRYTTDGTDPTPTTGTIYTEPVEIATTTTLKAIGYRDGLADSSVTTGVYAFKVNSPAFSPAPGTYPNAQSVAINTTTSGAAIRYTTDGTTPTPTTGTLYTDPVEIAALTTLKAIAYDELSLLADSDLATGTYTLQTAAPVFSPGAGTYSNEQSVTLGTVTAGATIRYTTDGSEPTPETGLLYTDPVAITGSTTLKAIAFSSGLIDSTVTTGIFNLQAGPPQFSPAPGSYSETQNVTISTVTAGATIRYTTDGSEPSATSGMIYTGPITVSSTATVKAVAYQTGYSNSSMVSGNYIIDTSHVLILNDTFSDGDRTDGADTLDSQWRFMSNIAPNTGGVVDGTLKLERTAATTVGFNPHAITTFPSQTLAVGQTITLSFDFKSLGAANATGFRFGLYNSGGTNLTADIATNPVNPGTVFQNDLGYSVFAPHQQAGNITLYYRPTNSTANTLQVAAGANTTVVATGSLVTATNPSGTYQASLAISRLSTTQFNVAVNYAGNSFNQNYTPAAVTETFNTLSVFAITGQNQAFTLDNVRVSVLTPPPPNTLVTWRNLQGLAADGSQDLLNPSGDGVVNLTKYALNLAPNAGDLAISNNHPLANPDGTTVAELTGLPVLRLNSTPAAVFTYIRRKESTSPGITYTVQWSDGLTGWAANPSATETTTSLDTVWERVTLADSFATDQKPSRFARLAVAPR